MELTPGYFRLHGPEGEMAQGGFDVINNFLSETLCWAVRGLSPAFKEALASPPRTTVKAHSAER